MDIVAPPDVQLRDEGLYRLLYCSRVVPPRLAIDTETDLHRIIRESVRNNAAKGITGVLITDRRMYSQVIEGEEAEVRHLIGAIVCDNRHREVRIISHMPAPTRMFSEWSMALIECDGVADSVALFPVNDEQSDIIAVSVFCNAVRKHLLEIPAA